MRHGGALDPAEAAGFVAQAGAALDAIHRAGFVHRDVKPANLLVDPGGHVYLTDFGLAKQVLTRTGGTRTGQWVGTLDYVAPEQIRGGRIDARADVYALGGVLHFALTGRVPFEREGDEAKLWAQLSAPPPVPSALRRGLRAEFDVVVARAMAKDAGRALPVRRRPRPRRAGRRGGRGADRAGAGGRARRRRPGRGADRAGPRRRGLDAHGAARRSRGAAPSDAAPRGARDRRRPRASALLGRRRRRSSLRRVVAAAIARRRRAATSRDRRRPRDGHADALRDRRRRPRPRSRDVAKTIKNVGDRPNGHRAGRRRPVGRRARGSRG